jgi:16S rRNA (cytidine1402-2'-O)-methyltransferase
MVSLHEHSEVRSDDSSTNCWRQIGGLITDAGMPGISDPGFRLIRACRESGLAVNVLPGPSAVLTALVGSASDECLLFWRLSSCEKRSTSRGAQRAAAAARQAYTLIASSAFEDARALAEIAPEAEVCVARELTKRFEEYRRGRPAELFAHYTRSPVKGEITLVISGASRAARNEPDTNLETE